MSRSINKCLSQECQQVFLVEVLTVAARCPHCGHTNIGSVRRGDDEHQWPLDQATALARVVRCDRDDALPVSDLAAAAAA